ncbi:MAG: diguanylate cyclase [Campylobacterota bacterium]|nr:diguanylate cyclase [Campylobacterota bacterium]
MQPSWSNCRITLLLYFGILILPFSFYFNYSAIQDAASDTAVMHQLSRSGGEMLVYEQIDDEVKREEIGSRIDRDLERLTPWFESNRRIKFYVGGRTLQEDYDRVLSCWRELRADPENKNALECWRAVKSVTFTVDKMLSLKQNRVENIFYISFLLTVIFLLLMIFVVREYMHKQLSKHTIYDIPTKLFNHNYLISHLESACSRSKRHDYPLSMISVESANLDRKSRVYTKQEKSHISSILGGLINSLTRTSDIACRYDENLFLIILPDTGVEGAPILEARLRQALENHNFMAYPDMSFKVVSTQFDESERVEEFIERTNGLLRLPQGDKHTNRSHQEGKICKI